jgi:hypothetical protein
MEGAGVEKWVREKPDEAVQGAGQDSIRLGS